MWARCIVIMDCFAEPVSPEPQPRPLPRLLGLDLAVTGRRVGVQRDQQTPGGGGYLRYRAVECLGVGLRRLVEAGQFSHELQRGGLDFVLGRGRLEIEQSLDVAAHLFSPRPPSPRVPLRGQTQGRSIEGKTYIADLFWHRMGAPFTPLLPVSAKQASSP